MATYPNTRHAAGKLKFGAFELDLDILEIRKGGSLLRLKPQPFRVLAYLAENAGRVILREELREQIWGTDTFVDFERGLNSCMTQIRAVLNDEADSPRYIETLPRRGYRFLAEVEVISGNGHRLSSSATQASAMSDARDSSGSAAKLFSWVFGAAAVIVLVSTVTFFAIRQNSPPSANTQPRIMLAVLPFQNLSGDDQQEFFGDGMTEEMIAVLGGLAPERLGVIARTSAMRYKKTPKGIHEIAQELGVTYLMEGSIRREGNVARITAQLIRAGDQSHIWAQSYERPIRDVIGVQRDVAQQIARALTIELVPSAFATLNERSAVDPAVYDEYLLGRQSLNQMNGIAFQRAVTHFEKAIQMDPNYALAYAGLADAYDLQPWWAVSPPKVALTKGRAAALKALEIEPNLAEAHNSLGFVQLYLDWDLPAAEKSFRRAIELRPGFALAHYWYAGMLSAAGRHDEAIASIKRAQALDPFSEMVNSDAGWYYFFARRHDEAIEQCRRTIEMKPNFSWTYLCIYEAQVQKGQLAAAVETGRKLLELQRIPAEKIDSLLAGKPEEALERLRRFTLENDARQKVIYPSYFQTALTYISLGDFAKGFAALEHTIQDRDSAIVNIKTDPRLDPVRKDPRFGELLRKAGF